MRILGAFLAEDSAWVDGKLTIVGAGFGSTHVQPGTDRGGAHVVFLCESGGDDVGQTFIVHIEPYGPSGARLPGFRSEVVVPGILQIMTTGLIPLPFEPTGGHHSYLVSIEGEGEPITIPLDVFVDG